MIKVWVLVVFTQISGPMLVDNLVTKEDCLRLQTALKVPNQSQCIEVTKVK